MAGRNKGWHPSIWAAIITGAATIIGVIVTVMLNRATNPESSLGKTTGALTDNLSSAASVRLAREYLLRKNKDYVQFIFNNGTWNMATGGRYEGSMGGTYKVAGSKLTLIIERSYKDMASIQSPFTMNLDGNGILHMDVAPSWSLPPRGN